MDKKGKMDKNAENADHEVVQKKNIAAGIVHHVIMFMIGCAIGAVLTMLYTNFLPIERSDRFLYHRRVVNTENRRVDAGVPGVGDFGIFSDLRPPGAKSSELSRMKRFVQSPSATTVKPTVRKNDSGATSKSGLDATATSATVRAIPSTTIGPHTPTPNTTVHVNTTDLCPFTELSIKTYCQMPFQLTQLGLTNISLRDVISSVFSKEVMGGMEGCPPGQWCPQVPTQWNMITSMAGRWGDGNFQAQICPLLDCLTKLPKAPYCEDSKRQLAIETVTMLCSMPMTRETKLRDITCVKRVLMMEHRDMSDLSRTNTTAAEISCGNHTKACSNEHCAPLFTEFADLDLACDSYRFYIKNFGPWKWYYHSELKQKCDVQPSVNHHFSFSFVSKYRNQIVMLVAFTTAVLLIALAVSSIIFWRRRRVVYKRKPINEGEMAEMEGLLVT